VVAIIVVDHDGSGRGSSDRVDGDHLLLARWSSKHLFAGELHEKIIDPGSAGLLFSWSSSALVIGLGAFGGTNCHFSNRIYFVLTTIGCIA
jgi:hypothetical protein